VNLLKKITAKVLHMIDQQIILFLSFAPLFLYLSGTEFSSKKDIFTSYFLQ